MVGAEPRKRIDLGELMGEVELLPINRERKDALITIINPNQAVVTGMIARTLEKIDDARKTEEITGSGDYSEAIDNTSRTFEAALRSHPALKKAAERLAGDEHTEAEASRRFLLEKLEQGNEIKDHWHWFNVATALAIIGLKRPVVLPKLRNWLEKGSDIQKHHVLIALARTYSADLAIPIYREIMRRPRESYEVKAATLAGAYLLARHGRPQGYAFLEGVVATKTPRLSREADELIIKWMKLSEERS